MERNCYNCKYCYNKFAGKYGCGLGRLPGYVGAQNCCSSYIARQSTRQSSHSTNSLEKAAPGGDSAAMDKLGEKYYIEKDYANAAYWWEKAAKLGNARSQCFLGRMYLNGTGVQKDSCIAEKLITESAKQGNKQAQYWLGLLYSDGKNLPTDFELAAYWYEQSAKQGNKEAQYRLAELYYYGKGVGQSYQEAAKWYEKSAEQGQCKAQSMLGFLFYFGRGVCQDDQEAIHWFKKSADQGVAASQYALGHCYKEGIGLQADIDKAIEWMQKSAEQGYAQAKSALEQYIEEKETLNGKNMSSDGLEYVNKKERKSARNDFEQSASAIEQLEHLVGLTELKQEIQKQFRSMKIQKMREERGLKVEAQSRHIVFVGNPGTGKTTVARIMGQIYKELGILSKGQLVEVDRSDLVAEHIGGTAPKTLAKVKEAIGGILFIDEAYTLVNKGERDFGQEAIDTLLKAMEDYRNDFIVIIAGYPELIKNFINSNPGLESRFTQYFYFSDYTAEEMVEIFKILCKTNDYTVEENALQAVAEQLSEIKATKTDNFANAREVRNLFQRIQNNQGNRVAELQEPSLSDLMTITLDDVVEGEKEDKKNKASPIDELTQLIGLTSLKKAVVEQINVVKNQKLREELGLKTQLPSLHMVFTGNPGTGKTTVARIMAELYKEIGILSKGQLVEVDRATLVAGYVGQTATKTLGKIKEAKGGVLFIDEAYTLSDKGGNDFGQEAIDTLLKAMEDNRNDFIVIVAGYPNLMEKFINSNPGLASRFTQYFYFPDYTASEMEEIFLRLCKKNDYEVCGETKSILHKHFIDMEKRKDNHFANARDVRNYFEAVVKNQANRVIKMEAPRKEDVLLILPEDVVSLQS